MQRDLKPIFNQFWRFVIIGLINTALDYGILLILSKITGITSGNGIIPLNVLSFTAATTNSYFLSKRWAFDDRQQDEAKKIRLFLLISILAVLINTSIVRFITTNINPQFNLTPTEWLITAKVFGSAASLIWNFLGYKLIVFKK